MNSVTRSRKGSGNVRVEAFLGIAATDNLKLAKRVEHGLPFSSFERVERLSGLSAESLRAVVGIAPRTLARRKHEKRLSPEESDRLVSVSRVLALAVELFDGDVERGMQWLRSPSRALKGRSR